MNWSSSVLSSVSSDTEPSIIITFDHAKYIFNTSENTTRSFLQSGRNWKKTRALFYTQARVEKTGGLPGLIMTFADATIDNLSLYGPRGFNNLLASMRFYTYRETMKVQSTEIPWIITPTSDPTPTYVDDNLTVYAIPVIPCSDIPVSSTPKTLDNTTTILDISGKRKRDTSPDVPQKRPNTGNSSSKGLYSAALEHEMKKENFEPESLTGELADEYVSAVIRAMFPFTKPNTEKGKVTKPGSTKQKPKSPNRGDSSSKVGQPPSPKLEEKADVDDYRRSKVPIPPGFRLQLPQPSIGLSPTKAPPAMSYLVVGPTFRGKFNAEKATELGVPKGKIRSLLARGESITFDVKVGDEIIQRIVRAEEVVAQPEKPSAILILDVPSVDHIPSLISSFTSSDFYLRFWSQDPTVSEPKESDAVLRVAYHMCGEGVLEDQRYKAFMRGFGSVVHHIVGSREHCSDPVTFTSAAYSQLRLNTLDDQIFRVPKYRLHARKSLSEVHGLPENISPMHSHMKTAMRPWNPPSPDPEVVKRDKFHPIASGSVPLEFSPGLKQSIDNARKTVAQIVSEKLVDTTGPGSDVGIISLGTGGSMPSKYRNVLSTFIRIPKWGNILLDSGEGTWGQMVRNFGLEDSEYNVWQALRDLKCIFISHIHADHHIGLANILAKRKLLDPPPTEPLYVVSIRGVHLYLREISAVEDIGLNDPSGNGVVPVLTESMHYTARTKYTGEGIWHIGGDEPWLDFTTSFNNGRQMCNTLGLNSFQTIDVFHRCRCYGVVLRHKDGWSVAFSADTSPSDQLRRLGVDTTVLIHEATMADEEAEMARKKNHSTIGQAIAEGKKMRSKNIMLTHFSARYPKMPPYLTQTTPTATNFTQHNAIVPAFDHANFIIGDMWKMQFYTPSVSRNFKDTFSEEEDEDVDASPTNVSLG